MGILRAWCLPDDKYSYMQVYYEIVPSSHKHMFPKRKHMYNVANTSKDLFIEFFWIHQSSTVHCLQYLLLVTYYLLLHSAVTFYLVLHLLRHESYHILGSV